MTDVGRRSGGGLLDVLRVVVAARDDDEVLQAAGDEDLIVDDDAEVAGAHPVIFRCITRPGVLRQAVVRGEVVAEGEGGLFLAVEVAGSGVLAVSPQLTDLAVRELLAGLRVDDAEALPGADLTDGSQRHGSIITLGQRHGRAARELLTVEPLGPRPLVGLWGGDQQGGLGQPVGRAHRVTAQLVVGEEVEEALHGGVGDRLGAVDQAVDAGEIQAGEQLGVRLVGGVGVAGRQLEGEVRDDGVDVLLVVALVELLDPAGRVLQEVPRAHEVEGQAQDGGEGREDQAHVVVQR